MCVYVTVYVYDQRPYMSSNKESYIFLVLAARKITGFAYILCLTMGPIFKRTVERCDSDRVILVK